MILRHESALDGAVDCKVRVVLSLRKKYSQPATKWSLPPAKTITPKAWTSVRSWESTFRLETVAGRRCVTSKIEGTKRESY
jgi:hypothetical protein